MPSTRRAYNLMLSARLIQVQSLLVVAYAISLPLSLTASWVILCAGLALWASQLLISLWMRIRAGAGDRAPTEPPLQVSNRSSRFAEHGMAMPPLLLPLAVFAAAVVASGLATGGLSEALVSLSSLRALLVYLWAYQIFSVDRPTMFVSVQALLFTGAVAGLLGMVEQVFDFHPFSYHYLQGTGFLGGPMAFAGQMQIFSLLALGLLLKDGYAIFRAGLSRRVVFALLSLANIIGVVFASERSAWLGAVAGVLAIAATLSWRAVVKCGLVVAVVSFVAWQTIPVVHTRLGALANWQQDISARVRFQLWQESIKYWHASPIFGVGICRYPHFNISEAIVPGRSKDLNHAHSNYVHILTTTGVVGFAAFLWLWFAAVRTALKMYGRTGGGVDDRGERALALGIFGGIVALLVSGIFEYNFGTAQVRLAQWFVLAMLLGKRGSS